MRDVVLVLELLKVGVSRRSASGACGRESIKLKFRPLVFVTDVHSDIGRGRTLGKAVTQLAGLQAEFRRRRVGNCNESQKCHSAILAEAVVSAGVKSGTDARGGFVSAVLRADWHAECRVMSHELTEDLVR